MQEDLEGEFQSLYALLDELKDGMLTKIKQDRASRTYELQVSPRPPTPTPRPPSGAAVTPLPLCPPSGAAGGLRQGAGELGGAAGDGQPDPGDSQQPRLHPGEPHSTRGRRALSPPGCPGDRGRPVPPPPACQLPPPRACAWGHAPLFLRWAL